MVAINNAHIGKTCPFCQFPIKRESEVVICSECQIPHHQECWQENSGCTTFGCRGTEKKEPSSFTRWSRGLQGSNRIVIDKDALPGDQVESRKVNSDRSPTYSYLKAGIWKRIRAFTYDLFFSLFIPFVITGLIHGLVTVFFDLDLIYDFFIILYICSVTYMLIRDGFGKGQSPGKKIVGLMVVSLHDNTPCTIGLSLIRNVTYIIILYILWRLNLFSLLLFHNNPSSLLLLLSELIVIPSFNSKGQRLGDWFARTQVIEDKLYKSINSKQ